MEGSFQGFTFRGFHHVGFQTWRPVGSISGFVGLLQESSRSVFGICQRTGLRFLIGLQSGTTECDFLKPSSQNGGPRHQNT